MTTRVLRDDSEKLNELLEKMDEVIKRLDMLIYFKKERWWEKLFKKQPAQWTDMWRT